MRVNRMSGTNTRTVTKREVFGQLIMLFLMIGSAFIYPILKGSRDSLSSGYYIFAIILAVFATGYALVFEKQVTEGINFLLVPLMYGISFGLALLFDRPVLMPFWCFGGLLLLCAFGLRYSVFMNFYLLFLIGSNQIPVLKEALVMQIVALLLLGILMPSVKKWMDAVNAIISVLAIIVSVRIIFYLTARGEISDDNIYYISLIYTAVILACVLFSGLLKDAKLQAEQKESFAFLEELAAGAEEQSAQLFDEFFKHEVEEKDFGEEIHEDEVLEAEETVPSKESQQWELEILCSKEAPLLARLSKEHPGAYLHACRVAQIASEVSEAMEEVNTLLVKAGGYYHEIGRLCGKNTLENTLSFAKQNEFPEDLYHVLKEHTVNGDKPTSKEAAIVLLADNICGMCEYLKKNQKGKILFDKVIDKALQLRLAKGDLNSSGLSVKDFSVIRNSMTEVIKEDLF